MLGTTALFLIATGVSFPGQSAYADFADGTLAYESGDYERAYNEWLPMARAGNAAAQRNIGQLYRLGLGVPQDLRVAANWYRLAADQGLSRAQANLGVMYLRGEGVDRDATRAAEWFGKAAEQGHTIAQYNLALMLEQGYGVPRDTRQAALNHRAAADGGHDKAGDRLAAILSDSIIPAAGAVASTAPKPAAPSQTARAEDYLPARLLNRKNADASAPADPASPVQVAAAPPTTDAAPRRPNRLTEALTARPSPANIAGTPAARFAVGPTARAPAQVADLPESAPETAGLRRPAFLQAPRKAPRDDKPVQVALGASAEPRRTSGPVTVTPPATPPQALIQVPIAPFLKAEAVAGAQPATSPANARRPNVAPAPFLKAEANANARPPSPPAVPVPPVQVAAVTIPPTAPLVRREPAPVAFTVPAAPPVAPRAVPTFLQREAMAPPPGHDLIPRFGPNSYLAPRDIPVVLRLDAVPSVALGSPAVKVGDVDAGSVAPLRNDTPLPTERREVPAFLVRESQSPRPVEDPVSLGRETPTQLAALSDAPHDPVIQNGPLATLPVGARVPIYYVRRSVEISTPALSGVAPPAEPSPQQVAALTLPPPAPESPVAVKAVPAFLQREAATGEHDDTQEPVIVMSTPVAGVPRFLQTEARVFAPAPSTKLAALSPKPAPMFLAKEATAEAPAPVVPELLRREAADIANASPRDTVDPAPRPTAPPEVADPVLAAVATPAFVPAAIKPTDVPVFLREEAATGALAMVDTPRAGDPVGRAKRVTALLSSADDAAEARLPSAIPRYYSDRATLMAELELTGDDAAPLPFLRRAPRQNTGAPIQPIPDLLVAEAKREAAPVQPFLRNEAASAVRNNAPGTGTRDVRLAALPDADKPTPAAAPSRTVESAEDRRAVDTGVAAYLSRDYEKALASWLPAALRGNPDAQFFVAGLYLDGNGLERDLIQSHIWFARSASQGHQRAAEQMNLLRKIMTQDQYAEAERRRTTE
ncbi:MAG: SEL1-like repeat protein [Alphaproteobacteria bacterium]|nr:SEL1-like repeat protein [Alphaproteobacteria bacterium]